MKTHFFGALGEKPFLLLWLGQIFTQVAVNLFNFLLLLVAYSLTTSSIAVAGVVLSYTIPAIFFGVLAGAYVDRWQRKNVLYAANVIRAVLFFILAFLPQNLFSIYLISFLVSIATQFFIPAETPMIPLTVKKRNLFSANALFGMGLYGSILIAYIFSGPILRYLGEQRTLIFLSFLLLVGAVLIYFISVPKFKTSKKKIVLGKGLYQEIKHTMGIMNEKKSVRRSLVLLSISQILIIVVSVVAPGYASQVLGIHIEDFPILFVAPAAIGVVIGTMILVRLLDKISKERMASFGLLLSGIAMLILPTGDKIISRNVVQSANLYLPQLLEINIVHFLIFVAFVSGIANAMIFVPSNTTLQEKTSDEFRGKIYGVLNMVIGVFSLLPVLLVGGLSDIVGVARVITGIGVGIILLSISGFFLK